MSEASKGPAKSVLVGVGRYREGPFPRAHKPKCQVTEVRMNTSNMEQGATSSFCEDLDRLLCHCSMQGAEEYCK